MLLLSSGEIIKVEVVYDRCPQHYVEELGTLKDGKTSFGELTS